MSFSIIKNCIICGGDKFEHFHRTHDRHYGIEGNFDICRCTDCKLVFLNPMPSNDELAALYPKTYYSYQPDFFKEDTSLLKKIFKKYIIKIQTLDPIFKSPGKILDIGCGSGKFLYAMKENGWDVYGVEVNDNAAKLGNELANLNIHSGDLLSTNYNADFFDYVRSNHSFEHITEPREVLNEIHKILKPDGKLMIGVPNIASFNYNLFKKYWWYLGAPVHPFNYSVETLSKLLVQHGFKVEKVSYNGDWSGFIGSLQIFLNRKKNKLSDKGFFVNNIFLRVFSQYFAKMLNVMKTGDAIEIICNKKV